MKRLLLVGLAAIATSCVVPDPQEEPLPPYLLQKSMFEGEDVWWMNRTVVSAPMTAQFTWLGDGDYPDRVRFDIQEDYLIAYRATPIIIGESPNTAGLDDYEAPAAIWPIKRHFDVLEGQIIDVPRRAWYDKQWFEVDWANEQSNSYRFSLTNVEKITRESPAYTIMEPDDENAPIFSPDYVDFTTHLTIRASMAADPELQKENFCGNAVAETIVDAIDCSPLNLAYRTSLRKIPADHDYVPLSANPVQENPADAVWFPRFFRNGRLVYDDQYGFVDNGGAVVISRFNLWERSLGDDGRPLPLRDRRVKILPIHVSENMPDYAVDILKEVVAEWDAVFVSTVHEARAWECVDAEEGDYDLCKEQAERPEQVIAVCPNNPVKAGDPDYCGEPGTRVRLGDQRYFMVSWHDTPSMLSLLGVGWWVPDNITGEIYAGHIDIFPADIDRSAAVMRDMILLAQGRIEAIDFVTGAQQAQFTDDLLEYATNPYAALVETENPLPVVALPDDPPLATPSDPSVLPSSDPSSLLNALPRFREAALAPIVGQPEEVLGLDWEAIILAGMNPNTTPLSQEMIERASPFRRPFKEVRTLHDEVRERLATRGADVDFPVDIELATSVLELADASPEEIFVAARDHYTRWIMLHEFGHLLGMRHDFEGSYDSINFPEEYWELRDDGDMGPRHLDPITPEEVEGGIHAYATSSVMDYFQTPINTPLRLGYFDKQAVHWAYGGLVQVFDRELSAEGLEAVERYWNWPFLAPAMTVGIDDPTGLYGHRHTGLHYTEAKRRIGDLSQRAWVPVSHLTDPYGWGIPAIDKEGRAAVPTRFCSEELADFAPSCLRYDRGADQYEILSSVINSFDAYYPLFSFRRGRTDFRTDSYVSYAKQRLFMPIFDLHSNFIHLMWEYEPEAFYDDDFLGNVRVGLDMTFNYLARLIVQPEPGDYYLREFPDGEMLVGTRAFDNRLNPDGVSMFHHVDQHIPDDAERVMTLPLGVGRIYRTVDSTDGRGRLVPLNAGSALDKEIALEVLVEPKYFAFVGQGTWSDPRVWMDGWIRTHRIQLLDLFGAIAAGDYSRLAPVWTGTELKYRNFLDPQSSVLSEGTMVQPAIGFNLRIRTLVFALAYMAQNQTDRTFLDLSRIELVDLADPGTPPATAIEYTDQLRTGLTYRAYSRQIAGVEMGIGYRMLQRAQALQDAYLVETDQRMLTLLEQELSDQIDLITIIRAIVTRFDEHEYDFWKIEDDYFYGDGEQGG